MKKQKGTISILESIRNKMHKIEKPNEATNNKGSDIQTNEAQDDDDFEYIDSSKEIINSQKNSTKSLNSNSSSQNNEEDFDFLSYEQSDSIEQEPQTNETTPKANHVENTLETENFDDLDLDLDLDEPKESDSQPNQVENSVTGEDLVIEEEIKEESLLEKLQRENIEKSKNEVQEATTLQTNEQPEIEDEIDDLAEPEDLGDDPFDEIQSPETKSEEELQPTQNYTKPNLIQKQNDDIFVLKEEKLKDKNDITLDDIDDLDVDDIDDLDVDDIEDEEPAKKIADIKNDTSKDELGDIDIDNLDDIKDDDSTDSEDSSGEGLAVKDIPQINIKKEVPITKSAVEDLKKDDILSDLEDLDLNKEINNQATLNINSNLTNNNNFSNKTTMISDEVAKKTTDSIKELMTSIPKKQEFLTSQPPAFRSGETIEEMVAGLLAPKLEQWLNENLPSMVEKIVKEEIKKLMPQD
jgi:cell pole-organizing protein PopZ